VRAAALLNLGDRPGCERELDAARATLREFDIAAAGVVAEVEGMLALDAGRPEEAAAAFRRAMGDGPAAQTVSWLMPAVSLAEALVQLRRHEEAADLIAVIRSAYASTGYALRSGRVDALAVRLEGREISSLS
jgi:predicted Zn-dependent protease